MLKWLIIILIVLSTLNVQSQPGSVECSISLLKPGDTLVVMVDTTRLAAFKMASGEIRQAMPASSVFTFDSTTYNIRAEGIYCKTAGGSIKGPHIRVTGLSVDGTRSFIAIVSATVKTPYMRIPGPCRYTYAIEGKTESKCEFLNGLDECSPGLKLGMREKCQISYGKDANTLALAVEKHLLKYYPSLLSH